MRIHTRALAILTAALSLSLLAARVDAQSAMSAPSGTPIDCTKAGSMMTEAGVMTPAPDTSADVDKTFVAMAMMHEKAMMTMMHVEMQCGKNPKVMAAAQKGLADSQSWLDILRELPSRSF